MQHYSATLWLHSDVLNNHLSARRNAFIILCIQSARFTSLFLFWWMPATTRELSCVFEYDLTWSKKKMTSEWMNEWTQNIKISSHMCACVFSFTCKCVCGCVCIAWARRNEWYMLSHTKNSRHRGVLLSSIASLAFTRFFRLFPFCTLFRFGCLFCLNRINTYYKHSDRRNGKK